MRHPWIHSNGNWTISGRIWATNKLCFSSPLFIKFKFKQQIWGGPAKLDCYLLFCENAGPHSRIRCSYFRIKMCFVNGQILILTVILANPTNLSVGHGVVPWIYMVRCFKYWTNGTFFFSIFKRPLHSNFQLCVRAVLHRRKLFARTIRANVFVVVLAWVFMWMKMFMQIVCANSSHSSLC